ncbi:hypothetical protein [Phenylobacterium sp.]|uniref:hypothetical protein n=1 Tax=Phenylobacterium sp. TaxID=1871053 RepID=UPI002614D344|nr:hypothetical protein [Phenylobacterium sp.]
MEATHTPGPWGVEDPMGHCLTIVGNPSAPVCDWKWVATCDWPDEDNQLLTSAEVKANARLIASAPALLEALKVAKTAMFNLLLVAEVPDRFAASFNEVQRQVDAAISKAEEAA